MIFCNIHHVSLSGRALRFLERWRQGFNGRPKKMKLLEHFSNTPVTRGEGDLYIGFVEATSDK